MNKSILNIIFLATLTITTAAVTSQAADLAVTNTFTSGTPARAEEMNQNFIDVETAVNDTKSRTTALESVVADLQTRVTELENQLAAFTNAAPVADAGPDQYVVTGSLVTLDASGSTDADADPLTYSWSLTVMPPGSAATLSNPNLLNPTFTADLDGIYVISLVVNDGRKNSAADTVTVTAAADNLAPVANAGPDMRIQSATPVTLDGSSSTDANGDPLTYSWTLTSTPAGSTAVLADPATVSPSFTPDLDGLYVATLLVNDGTVESPEDTVELYATPYDFGPLNQSRIDVSSPCDTNGGTTITGGNIINQTWTATGSPYIIQGDITIPSGSTLTIQPGVTVCSAATDAMAAGANTTKVEINVSGTLTVAGNATAPVIFRAVEATETITWQGITIGSDSSGSMVDFAYIANAVQGIQKSGPLTVSNSVFIYNNNGMFINVPGSVIYSVFLKNNYGVYTYGGSQLTNLLIYQNTYGIYGYAPFNLNIFNCTIADNTFYGVHIQGSNYSNMATIRNSIITGNAYGIENPYGSYATVYLYSTNIWGNASANLVNVTNGSGNTSTNPLYVAAPFDYSLAPGSLCIDAGSDLSSTVPTDLIGTPRPQDGDGINGAAFDMGAYEYVNGSGM